MEQALIQTAVRNVLVENLRLKQGESYLFFTDSNSRWEAEEPEIIERREYLHAIYESFLSLTKEWPNARHDKYESTQKHGAEPRENIWKLAFGERIYSLLVEMDLLWRLKGGAEIPENEGRKLGEALEKYQSDIVDCVIAFPWYSSTHTHFRRLLNQQGCRYVSMPMLTQSVMEGPMLASWEDVAARTDRVYDVLREAATLHLKTPDGTDLEFGVGPLDLIHKDSGDFSKPGAFGNLPAGESYLVPESESVNGNMVLTSGPDRPNIGPTCAIVRTGRIKGFQEMTEYAEELEAKFNRDFEMRNIAELGIGTNPLAKDVSSMIEGEKICGTVHVAIGSDKWIGGEVEASEHLDHVLLSPTLTATMKSGAQVMIVDEGQLKL